MPGDATEVSHWDTHILLAGMSAGAIIRVTYVAFASEVGRVHSTPPPNFAVKTTTMPLARPAGRVHSHGSPTPRLASWGTSRGLEGPRLRWHTPAGARPVQAVG